MAAATGWLALRCGYVQRGRRRWEKSSALRELVRHTTAILLLYLGAFIAADDRASQPERGCARLSSAASSALMVSFLVERHGVTAIGPTPLVKLALPGGGKPASRYQPCTWRLSPTKIVAVEATMDWKGQL